MKPPPADAPDLVLDVRRRIDGGAGPSVLGRGVSRREIDADELDDVRGEWVGVPAARRHVLYAHGGYYVAGKSSTYRNLAGRLASGLGADVLIFEYRLAPEHPYPAGLDDAMAAYRALLDTGADPATVAVAGDSAGGGLALALLLRIRAEGLPLPAAAVLLSPWTDLTCSGASVDANDERDDILTSAALRAAAAAYAGETDPSDPGLSPLFGDLAGLPPLYVAVDQSEALLDDSLRLVERTRAAGVRCELRHTNGLFHIWPALVPFVSESRETAAEIVSFLDRELA